MLCADKAELYGKTIVIVSDSLVAVSWINNEGFGSTEHAQTIYDIREVLANSGSISVAYGSRVFNSSADFLAKKGSRCSNDFVTWSDL